ncbi:unnamed protein product, partial [Prorocentrum cordatum]
MVAASSMQKAGVLAGLLPLTGALKVNYGPSEQLNCGGVALNFEDFVQKYERQYSPGSEEYAQRQALFESRVDHITSHNCAEEPWKAQEELQSLRGYKKAYTASAGQGGARGPAAQRGPPGRPVPAQDVLLGPPGRHRHAHGPGLVRQLLGLRLDRGAQRARRDKQQHQQVFRRSDRRLHPEPGEVRRQRGLQGGHGRARLRVRADERPRVGGRLPREAARRAGRVPRRSGGAGRAAEPWRGVEGRDHARRGREARAARRDARRQVHGHGGLDQAAREQGASHGACAGGVRAARGRGGCGPRLELVLPRHPHPEGLRPEERHQPRGGALRLRHDHDLEARGGEVL